MDKKNNTLYFFSSLWVHFIHLCIVVPRVYDCSHEIKRCLLLGRKAMTNLDSILKGRDIPLPTKVCNSQSYGFSSSHVWMWELDHKEGRASKNWCFQTVVLEKTFESPLDCKEIHPVHPRGNQSWVFIGRTEGEAETPILWPPDVKSWLIWKILMLGKIEGRRRRGRQRMRCWMASPTQCTWVWASSGRWWRTGKTVCCSPWGQKELDTMGWQDNNMPFLSSRLLHTLTVGILILLAFMDLLRKRYSAYHTGFSSKNS